jgi:purine-binding chemotaxis protein CheW
MSDNKQETKKILRDVNSKKYITFTVADDIYAIEISHVLEIIGLHKITDIPKTPTYIKGVINLRGEIVPIVDTRLKFMKEEVEYNELSSIIVIADEEMTIGILVDRVAEVVEIPDFDVILPPEYRHNVESQYIKGVGHVSGIRQYIIDVEKFMLDEQFDLLNKTKEVK